MKPYSPYHYVNLSADDWGVRRDNLIEEELRASGRMPDLREVESQVEREVIFELFKFPDQLRRAERAERPLKVCIVGGGVAGLTAAYELVARGHDVTLLESEARLGGRIWTHRFDDGTYGELGAMRIPASHGCVNHYVEKFNLERRTFVSLNNSGYLYLRNHRTRLRRDDEWKQFLNRYELDERFDRKVMGEHPLTVEGKMVEDLSNDLTYRDYSQIFQDFEIPRSLQVLEQTTVGQLMRGVPQTGNRMRLRDRAFEYLGRATSMIWFERTAFLQYMLNELPLKWPQKYELVGGMDMLTDELARQIMKARSGGQTVDLKTGTRVVELRQHGAGVEAVWNTGGRTVQAGFDFVICAVPAAATARIKFDPPLPPRKYEALTNLTYASAGKTIIRCTERFWEQGANNIFGGGSYTDLPHQQSWYPSDNSRPAGAGSTGSWERAIDFGSTRSEPQPTEWEGIDPRRSREPAVLLAAYMWESNARRFASLSDPERTELIVSSVEKVHPEIRSYIRDEETDVVHCAWDARSSPGGGGWAFFAPGEQQRYQEALCEPVFPDAHGWPRVFFAGEHVAILHAWIQSAIQSSLSAVMHLVNSPAPSGTIPPPAPNE